MLFYYWINNCYDMIDIFRCVAQCFLADFYRLCPGCNEMIYTAQEWLCCTRNDFCSTGEYQVTGSLKTNVNS